MPFDPARPYNELPFLPPKEDLESKAVLKACISANRALAELKGCGNLIPNQSMLINAIPLQEAKLSSEIENIVTTNDKLYQAAIDEGGKHDPHTKEVVRYRTALRQGFEGIKERPLSTNLFCELCTIIKGYDVTVRKIPGTTLMNPATKELVYTPPEGEKPLRDILSNLEEFIHAENEVDPLVSLAVIHYQFEAIHPFHDGNGRTGRIINLLFLVEKGLLDIPVLYLSRYIIENKLEYYQRLAGVTKSLEWEPWILFMLTAIENTSKWTIGRIHAIRALFDETCEEARHSLPKNIYSKELMELIFEQPYCKISFATSRGIAKRQTASNYLSALVKVGILRSVKSGRERIFINPKLINILSA